MAQRFIVTEQERKQIRRLYEQSVAGSPNYGMDYGKTTNPSPEPIYDPSAHQFTTDDAHKLLAVLSFGADFIPEIGPLIGAGIGAYDAYRYYQEGDTKMACIALVLASLPFLGQGISNIPGVKELGKKGLNLLALKLGNAAAKYTKTEVALIKGINLNKNIVHKEAEGLFKRTLNNVANKAGAKGVSGVTSKVATIADKGLEKGINQGISNTIEKTAKGTYDNGIKLKVQ
jgi:hypothetical protein